MSHCLIVQCSISESGEIAAEAEVCCWALQGTKVLGLQWATGTFCCNRSQLVATEWGRLAPHETQTRCSSPTENNNGPMIPHCRGFSFLQQPQKGRVLQVDSVVPCLIVVLTINPCHTPDAPICKWSTLGSARNTQRV